MHNYGKMFYRVYIKQCQFSPNIDQDSENQNVKKKKKKKTYQIQLGLLTYDM